MQGFNMGRYVPPDQEGLTNPNKLHNKHPLGSRARKSGGLVVRFEMPFAVWCTTCKPHETLIGQGVRFNAEKKKIGNYFSTPVYSFRMRHTQCGGWIEIRTDPKNTAYVVVEGGRKRDTGEDKEGGLPGEIAVGRDGARGEGEKRDPFARLEGKVEDKRVFDTERSRILELQGRQMRDWEDPYEKSRRLRRRFRSERKGLEVAEARREALRDKMSLGIELVDETEEDKARAEMVDFRADDADGGPARAARVRPLFQSSASSPAATGGNGGSKHGKRSKNTDLMARRKETFRNELAGNTRAAVDPFLNDGSAWQPGIKRRRTANKPTAERDDGSNQAERNQPNVEDTSLPVDNTPTQAPAALVAYASDSE